MSVSTALFSSLTGLRVNEARLDVIGNNIANANTTAYKASRVTFQTAFAQTLTIGAAGTTSVAATNPNQIGLGADLGATTLDFSNGSLSQTGRNTDLAIQGNGFFIVQNVDGTTYYTRDGSFTMNSNLDLTTANGYIVQGFGVDRNYNVIPGILTDINIPIGQMTIARSTSKAVFSGNLDAAGEVSSQGSVLTSQTLADAVAGSVSDTSRLVNLTAAADPTTHLFAAGSTLTLTPNKGGRTLPSSDFAIGATTTLADLNAWLQGSLGIQTDPSLAGSPGVRVNAGKIEITGNTGTENNIGVSDLFLVSDNAGAPQPLTFAEAQSATGESCRTSFGVYDSLGNESIVDLTMALEHVGSNGNITWRFYAESADDSDPSIGLGTGTVTFSERGVFASATGTNMSLDRAGTGAATPVIFDLDFTKVTSLASNGSQIALTTQDGTPLGTLAGFNVDQGGMVMGQFTNGLSESVAQVALANFSNREGLLQQGHNLYLAGPNSGSAVVSAPGSLGAGSTIGGALEQSNVDMAREFIELIVTSTGFGANSRVISTADKLLTELLSITS